MADALAVLPPTNADGVPEDQEWDDNHDKQHVSCQGLALTWDNMPAIRQRMRTGYNLVIHYDAKLKKATNFEVEKNIMNVKANFHVLHPVCRLYANGLVNIDDLESEVKQIYSIYTALISSKHHISKQAWAIRYLIQVLKGTVKSAKNDPTRLKRYPKDSSYQNIFVKDLVGFVCFLQSKFEVYRQVISISYPNIWTLKNLSSPIPHDAGSCFAKPASRDGCPAAKGPNTRCLME